MGSGVRLFQAPFCVYALFINENLELYMCNSQQRWGRSEVSLPPQLFSSSAPEKSDLECLWLRLLKTRLMSPGCEDVLSSISEKFKWILHREKNSIILFQHKVDFSALSQHKWRREPNMLYETDATAHLMIMADLIVYFSLSCIIW